MDTFLRDLRHATRALIRMRGVGAVAVLTLAIGIGAATTMFSVVYGALFRPLPFSDPDRLVIVFNTRLTARDGLQQLRWSRPQMLELQQAARSFDAVASSTGASIAISEHGDPEQIEGEVVSPAYFSVMRVAPFLGRTFRPDEDVMAGASRVALVGERLWRRRFAADPSLVGGTVRINDVPLTVIGILPAGFRGLTGRADVWFPPAMAARLTYADYLTTPQHFITVAARLKDGVTLEQANTELSAIGGRFADEGSPATTTWSATAVPIGEARVDQAFRRSAIGLLVAATCVLLIACVNIASLLLARSHVRRREMAIRSVVGSSRGRLVRQLLTEGLVMAALAGACGTLLARWGVDWYAQAAPAVIPSASNNYSAVSTFGVPALDGRVLLFALATTLGTTLAFALVPALAVTRPQLAAALKEDDRGGGRQRRVLAVLVVTEIALAVLLLAGSGLLIESFARIQSRRAGFVPEEVLTFWVRPPTSRYAYPADGPAFIERLLTRIEAVPGVASAAVNRCTPFTGCSRSVVFHADRPIDRANAPGIGRHYVSANYFQTLGIPRLAGRTLTGADRAGSPPVAVVNEAGARRFWPGETPIGKRVWFGTTTGPFADPAHAVEIVGVVGDVKYEGVEQANGPDRADFYTSYLQYAFPDTMVIVKARAAAMGLLPALRSAVASVDPSLPIYDAMLLGDRIDAAVARPRFTAAVLSAFAGAALLLAAIGVYGVLSYSVSSRLREIGVRLALGADAASVVWLVLGEGLRLASIGAVLGIGAALAAARLTRGLVVGVSASDPRLLGVVVIVMLASAAAAAFLPARRAGALDPIVVLRNE